MADAVSQRCHVSANAVIVNVKVPIGPFLSFNDCAGEDLEFTGTQHFLLSETEDGDGGLHFSLHVNWQNLRAVGVDSETLYRAQNIVNISDFFRPPFPIIVNVKDELRFIAQKSNDAFVLTSEFRLVINANGDVVLEEPPTTTLECR